MVLQVSAQVKSQWECFPSSATAGSASIVVSIVVFITNLRVFWSVQAEFNWKDWIIPVAGLAAGLPIGIYLIGAWDEDQLRVVIGIVMMISAPEAGSSFLNWNISYNLIV